MDKLLGSLKYTQMQTLSHLIHLIDKDSDVLDIKEVIENDPPLCMNLLKVVNSAYFFPRKPIKDIQGAIVRLGYNYLLEFAMNQKLYQVFPPDNQFRKDLWKHSVATAITHKLMDENEYGTMGTQAYTLGLIHDIGLFAEEQFFPEFYEVLQDTNIISLENKILGFNHCNIGSMMCHQWNMPEDMAYAILNHHEPYKNTLSVAETISQDLNFGFNEKTQQIKYENTGFSGYAIKNIQKETLEELKRLQNAGLIP
ncbi:MAG: HDOD domain-containing protein [Candidatus Woesearchaeota archaeon]